MAINRVLYFDLLRFLATIAVVMLHISSMVYGNAENGSIAYWIGLGYNVPTRWAVPVFVMLSGALFLNPSKEISLKSLYGKYILRLVVILIFWTLLYTYILDPSMYWMKGLQADLRPLSFVYSFPYHLWFLLMLIGVYLMIPILKVIASNAKATNYFLILWLIFSVLAYIPGVFASVTSLLKVNLVIGYSGYFLLGYKLSITETRNLTKTKVILLFILSIVLMYILIFGGAYNIPFLEPLAPNVILFSTSVFLLAKHLDNRITKFTALKKTLSFVQNDLLGVYLIHVFFTKTLCRPHFTNNLTPALSIPLFTVFVFVASLFTIKLLRKIPVVRHICS